MKVRTENTILIAVLGGLAVTILTLYGLVLLVDLGDRSPAIESATSRFLQWIGI